MSVGPDMLYISLVVLDCLLWLLCQFWKILWSTESKVGRDLPRLPSLLVPCKSAYLAVAAWRAVCSDAQVLLLNHQLRNLTNLGFPLILSAFCLVTLNFMQLSLNSMKVVMDWKRHVNMWMLFLGLTFRQPESVGSLVDASIKYKEIVILLRPTDMVEKHFRCANSFSKYNKKYYFPSSRTSLTSFCLQPLHYW